LGDRALSFQAFNGLSPCLGREREGKGIALFFCGLVLSLVFLGSGNSGKLHDLTVDSTGKKALAFAEMVACLLTCPLV
jgi:hypothetical protein